MSLVPKRILQLSQDVVDKIAAGEVVVRPVNAVKELVENSIDAGASEVIVSISGGGLQLIRVQDNGHGISADDLPLVCCRFTTSKILAYEDLRQISTFGFRGEAMASISSVATLTVTTKTAEDKCAFKAVYRDGQIVGQISQSAGLPGTIICIENLFHNLPSRLASFRQPNEEATRIADLIVRYAIHYPHVAFAFRRLDGKGYDFRTFGKGDQHNTIRALLHEKASKELVNIEFTDKPLHFSVKACLCTPAAVFTSRAVQSRHDKLKVFHLFINGRSVECPRLQRAFDAVFTSKDALCPFVSLSLQIEPERVDVNVHPTKAIVHFLDEDRIIERIEQEMHKFLTEYRTRDTIPMEECRLQRSPRFESETSRKRKQIVAEGSPLAGKKLPTIQQKGASLFGPSTSSIAISRSANSVAKVAPKDKIRVDFSNHSLDEFVLTKDDRDNPLRPNNSQVHLVPLSDVSSEERQMGMGDAKNPITVDEDVQPMEGVELAGTSKSANSTQSQPLKCIPRMFDFDSLVQLRKQICRDADDQLIEVFKRHLLVGFFDTRHALLQSGAHVFLVRNDHVLHEFFYQLIIFSFGNMGAFDLVQSTNVRDFLPVRDLLHIYLDHTAGCTGVQSAELEQRIDRLCMVLVQHREMLWDYFSLKVLANPQKEGSLCCCPVLAAIPCLIDGYLPDLAGLPRLLCALARVDYANDQNCYAGIASALAEFHVPFMEEEEKDENGKEKEDAEEELKLYRKNAQRVLRALVFPTMKNRFLPGKNLREHVTPLTSTAQAFKHFGRC